MVAMSDATFHSVELQSVNKILSYPPLKVTLKHFTIIAVGDSQTVIEEN